MRVQCMKCNKRITGTNGVIHNNYVDHQRAQREIRQWERHQEDNPASRVMMLDDLDAIPQRSRWLVHCNDCNPHYDGTGWCGGCYWFDADRCHTAEQLLTWTGHLNGKVWLRFTDWADFVARAGRTGVIGGRESS